jgi:HEAT repeat protein
MLGVPKIELIKELIAILKSGDVTKQIYAAKALGNIGKSS